jgi:hypothetical protein
MGFDFLKRNRKDAGEATTAAEHVAPNNTGALGPDSTLRVYGMGPSQEMRYAVELLTGKGLQFETRLRNGPAPGCRRQPRPCPGWTATARASRRRRDNHRVECRSGSDPPAARRRSLTDDSGRRDLRCLGRGFRESTPDLLSWRAVTARPDGPSRRRNRRAVGPSRHRCRLEHGQVAARTTVCTGLSGIGH